MELTESINLMKLCETSGNRHVSTLDHGRGTSARDGDLKKGKMCLL